MLKIRLQRVGKKNQAAFRIVLAEKEKAVKKQFVELLGHYNPRTKELGIKDEERTKYWIGQNVELSETVHNLFIDKGLLQGEKVKAWKPKAKPAEASAEAPAETAEAKPEETSEQPKQEKAPAEKPEPEKKG